MFSDEMMIVLKPDEERRPKSGDPSVWVICVNVRIVLSN